MNHSDHVRPQRQLFQYASGYLMHKSLESVVEDQTNSNWDFIVPSNPIYQMKNNLSKSSKFGRTIYVPYNRVIVISGSDGGKCVNDVFQFNLINNQIQKLAHISKARKSFTAHYDFGDKYIYVLGGSDDNGNMVKDCEKYDVYNNKWIPMPQFNFERGNPGTFITEDKKYLYAF